jgi:hypothetical protein
MVAIEGNPAVSIPEFSRQFAEGNGIGLKLSLLERYLKTKYHPSWLRVGYDIHLSSHIFFLHQSEFELEECYFV